MLLLLAGAAGGSYVWFLWTHTDEMLQGRIDTAFKEAVPDWGVSFSGSRFDYQGQIRVSNFVLKLPKNDSPILNLHEAVVSVDREQLGQQRLVFQQIRLVQPRLDLVRDSEGHWNWEGLGKLPEQQANLPEWLIERGTIRIRLESPAPGEPATAVLQNAHLQLTPSGKRRYLIKGTALIEPVGMINLDGHWHLDDQKWMLNGRVEQLKFATPLWDKICEFFPQSRNYIAAFPEKVGFPLPGPPITDPQLDAVGDLFFRLTKASTAEPLDYKLLINLKSGTWTHPVLSHTLDDVQGKIYCDPTRVRVPSLSGRHGTTQVVVREGNLDLTRPEYPLSALASVKNLPLDPSTRARLNPHLRVAYDHLQPSGKVNVDMYLSYDKMKGFRCDSDVIPLGCTVAHVKFPYPIDNVQGLIKKRGVRVDAELRGMAGQREVRISSVARVGGEHPGARVDVRVDALPLDEVFVLSTPEAIRKVLRSMNLQGVADFHWHMTRNGNEEVPWATRLLGRLHSGSMNCKCFPYAVNDLEGLINYDGQTCSFTKLKGTHGATELTGEGEYHMAGASSGLGLTVRSVGTKLDQELEHALPEGWKKLWQEFTPQGSFDCTTTIDWIPGQHPEISLDADLIQTAFQLKSFPFPVEEVQGHVSFHRDQDDPTLMRADLTRIEGRHGDTKLTLHNGFALIEPNHHWRVRLDDLRVEDLTPNNRFRRALPVGFREVIETLDPRDGSVSLTGMIEFRGTGDGKDGVTSAWDLEILCAGTSVTAGVDLKHLYGKFLIKGTWDGQIIVTDGMSDLTSMTILGYQFSTVRGPISLNGNHLYIGSRELIDARRTATGIIKRPPQEQRITGRAINGIFTLDGIAVLGSETSYTVVMTMRDALLERYAELYLPNQHDLRGIMTGEAELSGRGNSTRNLTGRGQLLIRPAALYQLPVMLAVVKQLNGGSPNNTAFDEAQAFFKIANNQFEFDQVDLKGAALNLKGFGRVRFDRRISFDFFSSVPRARAPLAILQQVVGQATVGWMGVEVRGTLDNPDAQIRPAQRMNDAVKRFLGGIDPRPSTIPTTPAPPTGRRVPIGAGNGVPQR